MRAPSAIPAFLLATLGLGGVAHARVPLFGPRFSLSLALDWNQLAVAAMRGPRACALRRPMPELTVTAAAPAHAPLELAAYGRVQGWMRDVLSPHYARPDADRSQRFHQLYVSPYAPYLGAYGLSLTVETNLLLR